MKIPNINCKIKMFCSVNPSEDPDKIKKDRLKIVLEEGSLYAYRHTGEKDVLIPVKNRQFRYVDEPIATMAFIQDEAGDLYLQSDEGNFVRVSRHLD